METGKCGKKTALNKILVYEQSVLGLSHSSDNQSLFVCGKIQSHEPLQEAWGQNNYSIPGVYFLYISSIPGVYCLYISSIPGVYCLYISSLVPRLPLLRAHV